jgi:poly(glycerol-phosphate) alpha-glucosyltransferase
MWFYLSAALYRWHRRTKRPYMVTPHGMLEPWALRRSKWVKRIAAWAYENQMLRNAAVLHAGTDKELHDLRRYGLRNPVAIIPNGVDTETVPFHDLPRENRILFLGRIHPKKGISELIAGWSLITAEERKGWRLSIAGWDDGGYLAQIQQDARARGVASSIDFLGPVLGDAKWKLFASVQGFILPSHSEGLPMAVLEAWSQSTPVLMTEMCNLPQGYEASAAIRIELTPEGIARSLREFFALPDSRRRSMGTNGHALVQSHFSWKNITSDLFATYQWMLGHADRPSCVQI